MQAGFSLGFSEYGSQAPLSIQVTRSAQQFWGSKRKIWGQHAQFLRSKKTMIQGTCEARQN